jgi:hypothetical protein
MYLNLGCNLITSIKDFNCPSRYLTQISLPFNKISTVDGMASSYGCRVNLDGNPIPPEELNRIKKNFLNELI